MKIPVLKINQFKENKTLKNVYVNDFFNHIQINKNLITTPHSHNFHLCVLFTKGTGTHEIDFNSYTISPGKVFFLKPGQTHSWRFDTNPEGYIFFHTQDFYDLNFLSHGLDSFPFYYSYQNPPILQLDHNHIVNIKTKFDNLFKEYSSNNLLKELKIVTIISSIYIDLTRVYTAHVKPENLITSSYSKILEQLEILINQYFYTEKLPSFYAEKLNITTKHLNRVVKQTLNKTTSQLISDRILLEAKRLIVHSNNNLAQVANTLEFSDYAYFSKFFKSKTGITPLGFKKKY